MGNLLERPLTMEQVPQKLQELFENETARKLYFQVGDNLVILSRANAIVVLYDLGQIKPDGRRDDYQIQVSSLSGADISRLSVWEQDGDPLTDPLQILARLNQSMKIDATEGERLRLAYTEIERNQIDVYCRRNDLCQAAIRREFPTEADFVQSAILEGCRGDETLVEYDLRAAMAHPLTMLAHYEYFSKVSPTESYFTFQDNNDIWLLKPEAASAINTILRDLVLGFDNLQGNQRERIKACAPDVPIPLLAEKIAALPKDSFDSSGMGSPLEDLLLALGGGPSLDALRQKTSDSPHWNDTIQF